MHSTVNLHLGPLWHHLWSWERMDFAVLLQIKRNWHLHILSNAFIQNDTQLRQETTGVLWSNAFFSQGLNNCSLMVLGFYLNLQKPNAVFPSQSLFRVDYFLFGKKSWAVNLVASEQTLVTVLHSAQSWNHRCCLYELREKVWSPQCQCIIHIV